VLGSLKGPEKRGGPDLETPTKSPPLKDRTRKETTYPRLSRVWEKARAAKNERKIALSEKW